MSAAFLGNFEDTYRAMQAKLGSLLPDFELRDKARLVVEINHRHIIDIEPLIRLTLVSLGLDPHPPPIRPPGRTPLDLEFDQRTDYDD